MEQLPADRQGWRKCWQCMEQLPAESSLEVMLFRSLIRNTLLMTLLCVSQLAGAAGLDAALQGKVDAKVKEIQSWAADATLVSAVKAYNSAKSPEAAAMDQAKWSNTSVIDPYVRSEE